MKKLTLLLILCNVHLFAQNNPYKGLGKEAEELGSKVLTLSNGTYNEFFDNDTIVQIGSVLYNVITKKVVGVVKYETTYSEATLKPEIMSRWLSPDPLAREFPHLSPYNFVENNPINLIDPTGLAPEDWQPEVKDDGSVSYNPEPGDNASTFASQYGVSLDQANQILCGGVGTVSGQDVYSALGTDVLKLNLNSELATEQRILDQWVFGVDYSKGDGWAFESTDFYSNTKYKDMITGSGYINVDGQNLHITAEIPVYRSATFDGSKKSIGIGNRPFNIEQTTGNAYGQTDRIEFDIYHPNTGATMGQYQVLSHRKYSDKVYNRLQKSFPMRSSYLGSQPQLKK